MLRQKWERWAKSLSTIVAYHPPFGWLETMKPEEWATSETMEEFMPRISDCILIFGGMDLQQAKLEYVADG